MDKISKEDIINAIIEIDNNPDLKKASAESGAFSLMSIAFYTIVLFFKFYCITCVGSA